MIIKCSSILLLEALTTIFLNLKWMGGLKFVILSRVVGTSTKCYANMLTRVGSSAALLFCIHRNFWIFFSLKFWKKKSSQVKGGVSANDWKFWWVWNLKKITKTFTFYSKNIKLLHCNYKHHLLKLNDRMRNAQFSNNSMGIITVIVWSIKIPLKTFIENKRPLPFSGNHSSILWHFNLYGDLWSKQK